MKAAVLRRAESKFVIYSGNSNPALASEIAMYLKTQVGRCITSSTDDEHFVILFKQRSFIGRNANIGSAGKQGCVYFTIHESSDQ